MCTEKYVNPFTDFGFKLLFGTPANKEFLIKFLNAILDLEEEITDISYNNTEVFGKTPDDRRAVFDLYCETSSGHHIIVEMQNAYQRYFMDRTIYYSSFPIQAASQRGNWDYQLPPVYTIAFLNFKMDEYIQSPEYKHVVRLMDIETKQVFFNKLTYIYLEMPKFNKEVNDLDGYADSWLYIIKNMVRLDEKPRELRDKVFERFFRVAEIARFTESDRTAYQTSLKIMRDYENTITSAREKGREQGREEGLERGLEMGRQEGLAEGILEMARKMKTKGFNAQQITELTGLTSEEIDKIQQTQCQ